MVRLRWQELICVKLETLPIPPGRACNVGGTSDMESDVSEGELSDRSSSRSSASSVGSEPLRVAQAANCLWYIG